LPNFKAFFGAMANTVIADNVKALHQGPTQSCSCLALHWLILSIHAQRSVHYSSQ